MKFCLQRGGSWQSTVAEKDGSTGEGPVLGTEKELHCVGSISRLNRLETA